MLDPIQHHLPRKRQVSANSIPVYNVPNCLLHVYRPEDSLKSPQEEVLKDLSSKRLAMYRVYVYVHAGQCSIQNHPNGLFVCLTDYRMYTKHNTIDHCDAFQGCMVLFDTFVNLHRYLSTPHYEETWATNRL